MSAEREQLETLYEEWKGGDKPCRYRITQMMGPILWKHASTVCWMVLRRTDSEIIREMVDEVLLHLSEFKGRSALSTWVHRVFLNLAYNIRQGERRRKEVPLDLSPSLEKNWESANNAKILLDQIKKDLSEEDRRLLELCEKGFSQVEIANMLGVIQSTVAINQKRLFRRLASKYVSK